MSSTPDHSLLFNRLLDGELSPQETELLIAWLASVELDPVAAELMSNQLKQPLAEQQIDPAIVSMLESKLPVILKQPTQQRIYRGNFLRSPWLRYAAAIIILVGIGALVFFNRSSKQTEQPGTVNVKKILLPVKKVRS